MKWLLLFFLLSCGKHQQPNAIDFHDSDGDQILNENDTEKGIANFETIGLVKGVLRIDSDLMLEIPFSNDNKIKDKTINLLFKNEKFLKQEDYFSEWSRINLETIDISKIKVLKQYAITLTFDSSADSADEIAIVQDKAIRNLGSWKNIIRLNISHEDLKALNEGKAYLSLRKKFKKSQFSEESQELSILNKTNRVYFFDGKRAKIIYASKELNLKQILDFLNISKHRMINDDDIFFKTDESQEDQWFTRELSTGEKIVVFSNSLNLEQEFLKKYNYKKTTVKRENGLVVSNLKLQNSPESTIYIRIKKVLTSLRTFSGSSQRRRYQTGGSLRDNGYIYYCTHYFRNISSETFLDPSFSNFLENIQISSNDTTIPSDILRNATIKEQNTPQGLYWEIKLNETHENLGISLIPKDNSEFVVTGDYRNQCEMNQTETSSPNYQTHPEGIYSFEIETLVEKIDE